MSRWLLVEMSPYRTEPRVSAVEVSRFTDSSVWIGDRRRARDTASKGASDRTLYCQTAEEATEAIRAWYTTRKVVAKERLQRAMADWDELAQNEAAAAMSMPAMFAPLLEVLEESNG